MSPAQLDWAIPRVFVLALPGISRFGAADSCTPAPHCSPGSEPSPSLFQEVSSRGIVEEQRSIPQPLWGTARRRIPSHMDIDHSSQAVGADPMPTSRPWKQGMKGSDATSVSDQPGGFTAYPTPALPLPSALPEAMESCGRIKQWKFQVLQSSGTAAPPEDGTGKEVQYSPPHLETLGGTSAKGKRRPLEIGIGLGGN
ncbi:hypothetical protein HGM15179_020056 [Zosterops borbonicus]|uniref:Uncharacterized protein n=1 Tax=Zosterops borbonicus TaxID=364589 RepID=A0A8K1D7L9_9PASS|nr:hypothetical protein HGM15179_020056 [Zosterops borbonicus]